MKLREEQIAAILQVGSYFDTNGNGTPLVGESQQCGTLTYQQVMCALRTQARIDSLNERQRDELVNTARMEIEGWLHHPADESFQAAHRTLIEILEDA